MGVRMVAAVKKDSAWKGGRAASAIMDAAERLFGQQGFAATSLRSICLAAGQGNNFAVQHHFGSKEGLAVAVFRRRMVEYEQRRAVMLVEATQQGRMADPLALIEVLFMPLVERFPDEGAMNYACFVRSSLLANDFHTLRGDTIAEVPITNHAVDLLERSLPQVPAQVFRARMRPCTLLFLNLVLDEPIGDGEGPFRTSEDRRRAALATTLAALSSPLPAEVVLKSASSGAGST